MITPAEYFSRDGRDLRSVANCVPADHQTNAAGLLSKVNALLACFDAHRGSHFVAIVASGYRTAAINACIPNAAKQSLHMTGHAIDIRDTTGELDAYLLSGAGALVLQKTGLVLEHPNYTQGWCHLQDVPVKSGSNPFTP